MIKVILVLFSHLVITFCAEWTDAQWSDYPFMVRLDIEKNGARYICGGSIISTSECKWDGRGVILTAAHCVSGATNVNVGIGCTKTSCTDSGAKYYNDDYYVIHPSYNPSLPTWDPNWINDDIALIYLSEPITNTNARKIDLHSDINVLNNNDNIRVFGYYGDCSHNPSCIGGSDLDSLEYADTHYMIATECDDTWGSHVTGPHDFCTKDDDASNGLQSICAGDSGSPLLFQNKQMGLNSWGASSCNPNLPGVATSIPHYYQWITSQAQQQCVDGLLPKGKYFRLQNRYSKSCIYQNSDGRFWYHLCGTYTDQYWILDDIDGNNQYFRLKNKQSGECIVNRQYGHYTAPDGWNFDHDPCAQYDDQYWKVYIINDQYFMLKNKHTGACMYQNNDGRFGVAGCNSGYYDQYWTALIAINEQNNNLFIPKTNTPNDGSVPHPHTALPLLYNNWGYNNNIWSILLILVIINLICIFIYCYKKYTVNATSIKYKTVSITDSEYV